MSTAAQIIANQNNAQSSTGPKTDAGKQAAALNSTKHGFTGQTLILTAAEKPAYETHVIATVEHYQPKTHQEAELIQQYADQQWTLHQINAQQIGLLSLLNAATLQHMELGSDIATLNTALEPLYKQLRTLGTYEQRRLRAAKATLEAFNELVAARQAQFEEAVEIYKSLKSQNKPFTPEEFGFVCSTQEIERHIAREARRIQPRK